MFCPNCGGESPDGSKFCGLCGQTFETPVLEEDPAVAEELPEQTIAETTVPAEEQPESMIVEENAPPAAEETASAVELSKPEQPMYQQPEQPVYQQPQQQQMYQQPEQPVYQQPQQQMYQPPYGAQPAYGQPYGAPRVRTPLDPKKKQAIIIASVCAAVLAAFLIVLFAAIIPNSGIKGKLRHIWVENTSRNPLTINLKNNIVSEGSDTMKITKWTVDGNTLQVDCVSNVFGVEVPVSEKFIIAMTTDGKSLLLFEADDYDPDYIDYAMKRAD